MKARDCNKSVVKFVWLSSAIATFLFGTNPAFANIYVELKKILKQLASYHVEAEGSGSFQIISTGAREGNNNNCALLRTKEPKI